MSFSFDELVEKAKHEGEVVSDPRTGKHEEACITDVEIVEGESPHCVITWGGMQDTDGKDFEFKMHLSEPRRGHPAFFKSRFLNDLKDLGLVPREHKEIIYIESEEARAALADALMSLIGRTYPITLSLSNTGFMRLSIRRPKREAN